MDIPYRGSFYFLFCGNGRDWDIDMQVDVMSLQILAEDYNQTIWTAIPSTAGPDAQPRDYFLDVNPFWVERVHGDGFNFIDARFIDTRNGLYIDITGLTELDPKNLPNIVSCKNYHNYRLEDIYPLRETVFEGAKVKVPLNYKVILAEEYGRKSLVLANYSGFVMVRKEFNSRYVWERSRAEWIRQDEAAGPLRKNGIAATPPTQIVHDDELPYGSSAVDDLGDVLDSAEDSDLGEPETSGIMIEELPADSVDMPEFGKGGILRILWDYLTLYWGS
jgi:hypothetical protein